MIEIFFVPQDQVVGQVPSRALSHNETPVDISKAQTVVVVTVTVTIVRAVVDEFQAVESVAEL